MKSVLKVALTHDVDRVKKTYHYLTFIIRALKRRDVRSVIYQIKSLFRRGTFWNFERIIDYEDKHKLKSTFFFLNETIRFDPFCPSNWPISLGRYQIKSIELIGIIREIDRLGWEVGVHGSYLSYKDELLLRNEKAVLENVLGHPVIGIRQHYLNLKQETWEIQRAAGFKYDTSLGLKNDIGFPQPRPFRPFDDQFIVFPLTIMDMYFLENIDLNLKKLLKMINTCKHNNSLIVLNWHNNVFDENEYLGYFEAYKTIVDVLRRNDAHFDTLANYYKHFENYFPDLDH